MRLSKLRSMSFGPSDKMDPVLEIWVDDKALPITVRLQGLLDATTRSPLLLFMAELLENGVRSFLIDVRHAYVSGASGVELLSQCQREVCDAGGTVDWRGLRSDAMGDSSLRAEPFHGQSG